MLMNDFNRSYFEDGHQHNWPFFDKFFKIEIAILVFSNCYVAFFLWVNITAKQFHQNWTNIISVMNGQHLISTSAWIFNRLILLSDDYSKYNLFVEICSYIRLFCLCYVFMGVPMLIVERYFATLFIKNYEQKKRGYICYLLIGGSTVISGVIDIIYHESKGELVGIAIFTIFMASNVFGIIGNNLLFRKNQRFFEEFYSNERSCDLTERFQISENLKSGRLVNVIVTAMCILNLSIAICMVIVSFNFSNDVKNLCALFFDFFALMYSIIFPLICLKHSERWKMVIFKLGEKFGTNKSSKVQPLQNSFGTVMTDASAEAYFDKLNETWA